jgi:hypothetical protein
MDSTTLHDQFRRDVDDRVAPYLWSSDEVFGYLDDAQKLFCRLTGGIGDASTSLTLLSYTAGAATLACSPLILKIRAAYDEATGTPVEIVNIEDMAARGMRFDGRSGPLRALVAGMEPASLHTWPLPAASGGVRLVVERLPLATISDFDQTLEVADHHQHGLSLWMRARAYTKQDADTLDARRADNFNTQFRAYCDAARREKDTVRHKPRVVAYGGI